MVPCLKGISYKHVNFVCLSVICTMCSTCGVHVLVSQVYSVVVIVIMLLFL